MNNIYGCYWNKKFTDIWSKEEDFEQDIKDSGIPTLISDDSLKTLYYLLYSKYGNSTIANNDENQFKYGVYRIVFEYGPTWEKKLDIQKKLRELNDNELIEGSKQIYNKALNPSTQPGTYSDDELQYINDQTVAKSKRGKVDAYAVLIQLLENDVTEDFLRKFSNLFIKVVMPQKPLYYITEEENN